MSDIAVLAHLAPVLGDAPSGRRCAALWTWPGLRRCWTGSPAPGAGRAHVWALIEDTPAGFPWLEIAGKALTGWLVIDMDATLVTAARTRRSSSHLEKRLRLPSTGRLARQYP